MEYISSRTNPRLIAAAKLRDRKYRDAQRQFLIDGKKLYAEALACSVELKAVFVTERFLAENADFTENERVIVLSDGAFRKLSEENAPDGIICVAKYIDFLHNFVTIYNTDRKDGPLFAACEVQDPGNVGTIIRTANAFGVRNLILSGCADLYHPRTVRAAMGGLFRQRVTVVADFPETVRALQRDGYAVYAAALHRDSVSLDTVPPDSRICYVVGNEGHGLSDEVLAACDRTIFIPIAPHTESLNVSAAASVLMWHNRKI